MKNNLGTFPVYRKPCYFHKNSAYAFNKLYTVSILRSVSHKTSHVKSVKLKYFILSTCEPNPYHMYCMYIVIETVVNICIKGVPKALYKF